MSKTGAWIDGAALRKVLGPYVVGRSLFVAIVVGTILNVINQGPDIVAGKPLHVARLVLTYAVPFFVASYGAYSAFRQLDTVRAHADAADD